MRQLPLRDVEIRAQVTPGQRRFTPLFPDSNRQPYTHSKLDRLFKAVMTACFGKAVASIYSWHSYRSGLATALHAAGVDDARIQLICLWLCPASWTRPSIVGSALHLYTGPHEHMFVTFTGLKKESHACGYCGELTSKFCYSCEQSGREVIAVCGRKSKRDCIDRNQRGDAVKHGSWRLTKCRA